MTPGLEAATKTWLAGVKRRGADGLINAVSTRGSDEISTAALDTGSNQPEGTG